MGEPLISTMPALPLIADSTIEWVAINPSTGADVNGVVITNPSLYGIDLSGNVGVNESPPDVEPLWVPLPSNLFAPTGGSQ